MRKIEIKMPEDVEYIIETLEKAGYEAYAVGGCVRDIILGRKPEDWDITTSAKPDKIKELFNKTIDTGIEHGTVTVMLHNVGYEVTTYRIDGEYEDGRHPTTVEFTDNLVLDLERRDFTINAMAYNKKRGIVDEFDGITDIENGIIRCVGNAGDRFDEDALRMLRAVRFSGQLCFEIEEDTKKAIRERAFNLEKISAERIRVEMTKLLNAKDSGMVRETYKLGMTKIFLPELDEIMEMDQKNRHHIYTVGEHSIRSVEIMNYFFGRYSGKWDTSIIPDSVWGYVEKIVGSLSDKQKRICTLTMLLHDLGKKDSMKIDEKGVGHFYGHQAISAKKANNVLKRLTFDNDTIKNVEKLVLYHDYQFGEKEVSMRRAIAKIGQESISMLFLVRTSDILSQNPETFEEKISQMVRAVELWEKVISSNAALSLKDLAVTGKDIMDMGVEKGPRIGELLNKALDWVIMYPEKNDKENIIKFLQNSLE